MCLINWCYKPSLPFQKTDFMPITFILVKVEVLAALLTDTGMAEGEVHQDSIKKI